MSTDTRKNPPLSEPMNTALDDLRTLVRDAEQVLSSAGDAAGSEVEDLQARLRDALDASRSRLRDLKDSAREHLDECDEYVRSHPYQSIGVAVAVGALIGVLLGRRS